MSTPAKDRKFIGTAITPSDLSLEIYKIVVLTCPLVVSDYWINGKYFLIEMCFFLTPKNNLPAYLLYNFWKSHLKLIQEFRS